MKSSDQHAAAETPYSNGTHRRTAFLIILLLSSAPVVGTYSLEQRQIHSAHQSNVQLTSHIESLTANIQKQTDENNGIATTSAPTTKAGEVSMMNGAITFTLPQGWTQTPAESCGGGATIDGKILCYDVANITAPDKTFTANVAVYQHEPNGGTARQWVEGPYFGPLATYDTPFATALSDAPINGDSAFSFTLTAPASKGQTAPNYVDATYTVVHGNYAVALQAQVEESGGEGPSQHPYDDRQTYQLDLQNFMQSIKFKD